MHRTMRRILRPMLLLLVCVVIFTSVPTAFAQTLEEQLEEKIQQIIAGIPASADTDSKVALYLHDYIVYNVEYQLVGEHQTAYGALLDGKAVCAGYADAYQRLLNAAGIRAYTILGTADNGDGNLVSHAWTMLYLDGACVFTDVTWDDPFVNGVQSNDNISYTYFQLSMEDMHKDHFPSESSKALLPSSCNHSGLDYYSVMQGEGTGVGIFNHTTTPQQAALYFKYLGRADGSDMFVCDFRFDNGDMRGWISRNWVDIALSLGLTGSLGVSYQYNNNTAKVILKGTLSSVVNVNAVFLTPSSMYFDAVGKTGQLTPSFVPYNATNKNVTYTSSDPSVATVTSTGLVTAVSEGSAVITVRTNDGGMTATCTVTVSIPAPPPTETTKPTEPIQPTEPPMTTVPPVTTEPPVNTEPPVTTDPEETTAPVTEPAGPTETTPATGDTTPATVPSAPTEAPTQPTTGAAEETLPTAPIEDEISVPQTAAPVTRPAVPTDTDPGSNSVMPIVLISGAVLVGVFALIFILKRRF